MEKETQLKTDLFSDENLINEFIKILDMDNIDLINDKEQLKNLISNKNEMIYNLIQIVLSYQENL